MRPCVIGSHVYLWPPHRVGMECQALGGEGSVAVLGDCCIDVSLLLGPQVCNSASPTRSHQDAHTGKSSPKDGSKTSQQ